MDQVLRLTDANLLFEDRVNGGNWREVHQTEFGGHDYESYISTRCHSTADTLKYLTSGTTEWQLVTTPTQALYQVSFKYAFDDEEDLPCHTMIVHGENVYQSYANRYALRRTQIPHLAELLKAPQHNWAEITGVVEEDDGDFVVCYHQPRDYQLHEILNRYHQLTNS